MLKNSSDVFCFVGRQRLDEIDRRRGLWRGLAEKRRQRLRLVAGLDFLHVVEVGRVEELRAIDGEYKLGLRADHLLHALGRLAFPARPGDEEAAAIVAGRAAADVVEVERVERR